VLLLWPGWKWVQGHLEFAEISNGKKVLCKLFAGIVLQKLEFALVCRLLNVTMKCSKQLVLA
jgi:hypothetical protein